MHDSNTKAASKPATAAAEPRPDQHRGLTNTQELARALNKWLETQAYANGPVTVTGWANRHLATSNDYIRVNIDVSIHGQLDESNIGCVEFRVSGGDLHASTSSEGKRLRSGDTLQLPPAGVIRYDGQHGLGPVPETPQGILQALAKWLTLYMREAAALIRKSTDRPDHATGAAEPHPAQPHYLVRIFTSVNITDLDKAMGSAGLRGFSIIPFQEPFPDEARTCLQIQLPAVSRQALAGAVVRLLVHLVKTLGPDARFSARNDNCNAGTKPELLALTKEIAAKAPRRTQLSQTQAAAEPAPKAAEVIPQISVILDTENFGEAAHAEDLITESLRKHGFSTEATSVGHETFGDDDTGLVYHARDIRYHGKPQDLLRHFQAWLKYAFENQEHLHVHLEREWLPGIVHSFQEGTALRHHGVIDTVTIGATEPTPVPTTPTQAAAEPGTGTSQYRYWFEKQIHPDAKRTDIRMRYRGMDLALSRQYTADKNILRYGVYVRGTEPTFSVEFSRAFATMHSSTHNIVTVALAPDFQKTMLAVLLAFDDTVQTHIKRNLRTFVFYQRDHDIHGYINGDKLVIKVTASGGKALQRTPGPLLVFPLTQLREWMWAPGKHGWHETLLGLCAEAWNSYKNQPDKGSDNGR